MTNLNWFLTNDYKIKKREVGDEDYESQVQFSAREEEQLLVRSLYADNSLEDRALALLNPLAHRVKVGSEVASCWEVLYAAL